MPLKKVDTFNSKMTYAINTQLITANFLPAIREVEIVVPAFGIKKTKIGADITYGVLHSYIGDSTYVELSQYSFRNITTVFMDSYDTRYGIKWDAKLSGVDDIKLNHGVSSFNKLEYYYLKLRQIRWTTLEHGEQYDNFEGWYQNA